MSEFLLLMGLVGVTGGVLGAAVLLGAVRAVDWVADRLRVRHDRRAALRGCSCRYCRFDADQAQQEQHDPGTMRAAALRVPAARVDADPTGPTPALALLPSGAAVDAVWWSAAIDADGRAVCDWPTPGRPGGMCGHLVEAGACPEHEPLYGQVS